nr:RNA-directed DNA polymerase, eukaryota [Tanacetum cinerariifolium]
MVNGGQTCQKPSNLVGSQGRFKLNFLFPNRLSNDQVADLNRCISHDEIRGAVWNCGVNKSPGLDGFTFEFFRRYWSYIGLDFCSAIDCFFESGNFSMGSNASFIALIPKVTDAKFVTDFRPISLIGCVYKVVTKILANRLAAVITDLVSDTQSAFVSNRQILDGPFILNELIAWCKRKKKQAVIFKVDFAKAYDSVRWDYPLDVLHAFGFGPNWCKWIRGTFSSSMASVLVNGNPSSEFSFFCGLKQGDPLAPFLFILIMESLHVSFSRATSAGVFNGFRINDSTVISHLFYADDAIFMGEWSDSNMGNIVKIIRCFFLASGLKISIQKSQILGVGVHRNHVSDCMARKSAWSDIVHKLHHRLSKWKVKTLSLGDHSDRKIFWVSWEKVLASKQNGGLGVSSFYALNRTLLLKWVWRFISQDGSLWYRVIQALYGSSFDLHLVHFFSLWCSILREMYALIPKGFNFISHCKKRIGDGRSTRFWYDPWVSVQPLHVMFLRIFSLESDKDSMAGSKLGPLSVDVSFRRPVRDGAERQQWSKLCEILEHVILSSSKDRWTCDLNGDGEFHVKEVRSLLDNIFLPSANVPTRWVKFISIKINIFSWRARLDRLPTRSNLMRRSVVMDSDLCRCVVRLSRIFFMFYSGVIWMRLFFERFAVDGS